MNDWKFELGATAKLVSGEQGEVIGRAEYAHSERNYYLRYVAGDGRTVEAWWGESALSAA
jgi:hypothetical protein